MGFLESVVDLSLFISKSDHIIYILIYVDDMIITSSSSMKFDKIMTTLDSKFLVRDLGELHFFLASGFDGTTPTSSLIRNYIVTY